MISQGIVVGMLLVVVSGTICPSQVAEGIEAILANCSYCPRAHLGIRVDQLQANGTWSQLYAQNPSSYFLPASNNKLLTTGSAFYEFGLDWTIETPIYINAQNDICLLGRGDPSMTNNDLLEVAQNLYANGLKSVRNVYVDQSYYQGPFLPQNWEWADITQAYGAIPGPLILDENTFNFNLFPTNLNSVVSYNFSYAADAELFDLIVTCTTSEANVPANIVINIDPSNPTQIFVSGTVPLGSGANVVNLPTINPSLRIVTLFSSALSTSHITVSGNASVFECTGQGWKEIGSITSPLLSDMMNYTLQVSDNIYAESFLMHMGKTLPTTGDSQTRALGLQKISEVLNSSFALDNSSFMQDDGSGVSRHNMISPDALIQLMQFIFEVENGDTYLTFLPTAGKTGTLVDRFINTTAEGVLHAKTGTLEGVNCLTGFIDHQNDDYPIIIFSILMNMGTNSFIPPVDEIGILLSTVTNC